MPKCACETAHWWKRANNGAGSRRLRDFLHGLLKQDNRLESAGAGV
ncbi:MAG: hypothetical protein OXC70_05650 [Gammaproteobacteria bacterium]|nr:hypothetical protein [Gammaproteobacteria bacterium]